MYPKKNDRIIILQIMLITFSSFTAYSQNAFETALIKKIDSMSGPVKPARLFPNDAANGMLIPSGWGGFGTYVFGYIGGAYPEVYTDHKADLIAAVGFCTGDPEKFINIAFSVNVLDVHRFSDFSGDIDISRSLGKGSSISAGGIQLFANAKQSDAPEPTFYVAFSHSVQTLRSKTPGCSKLTYTIGAGTGRFYLKSYLDKITGKGDYGTGVFGGVSYEVFRHVNFNAEWTGLNLGLSLGITPFKNPLSLGIGVTNLTDYSGDKPGMLFTLGYPLSLNRKSL